MDEWRKVTVNVVKSPDNKVTLLDFGVLVTGVDDAFSAGIIFEEVNNPDSGESEVVVEVLTDDDYRARFRDAWRQEAVNQLIFEVTMRVAIANWNLFLQSLLSFHVANQHPRILEEIVVVAEEILKYCRSGA